MKIFTKKLSELFSEREPVITDAPKSKLTSKDVQIDLMGSAIKLLDEVNLHIDRKNKIEKLEASLEKFKADNADIKKKIKQLYKFGFNSTPSTVKLEQELKDKEEQINKEISKIDRKIKRIKEIEKYTNKYAIEFPTFKFISRETMDEVLEKYGLYLGDVCIYNKEIPQHALDNAEKVYDKYIEPSKLLLRYTLTSHGIYIDEATKEEFENSKLSEKIFWENKHHCRNYYIALEKTFEVSDLKIVAPLSHFNTTIEEKGRKIQAYKNINNHLVLAQSLRDLAKLNPGIIEDDPILCLSVESGWIILDAWDEEAKIPEIKNVKLN